MYGELTDKDTVGKVEDALELQDQAQVEILLYKKNSKWHWLYFINWCWTNVLVNTVWRRLY